MIILSNEIREQVKKLVKIKVEEIEWMLADILSCKPMDSVRHVTKAHFRDPIKKYDIEMWMYFNNPIMMCKTWIAPDGQLKFELRRMEYGKKIIT